MRTKSILAISMAAATMMYGASVFSAVGDAGPFGTGKIFITGSVTNAPCDIAAGDDAIKVELPQVSVRHFKAKGDTSDSKSFAIHLRDCGFEAESPSKPGSAGKFSKVAVSFSSGSGYDVTQHAVTNPVGAKNIGVQILEGDNSTVIDFNTPDTAGKQLQAGNNELNFFARLIALTADVTPGDVNASVTYTLKYL
ncbi:fimbrial protein [Salmonella enterica]|nr:fimbrial protein [Salmonella enterica]